jgi:hypothetical protein
MSAFVFLVKLNSIEKKKFPLREKKGTKKNEEKRRAKRPSSSSFSAAKSDNGTITSRARDAQTREEVVVERERERDFALERGRRVAFFLNLPAWLEIFFSPWCARSLPRASSSRKRRSRKEKQTF